MPVISIGNSGSIELGESLLPAPAIGHRGRGGSLEFAADVAGVAVGEVGALHHQDVGDAFDRVNPRLRAPRAAVSVAAG